MWVKSTKNKLEEYSVAVADTQRRLADDEVIMHMEPLHNPEFLLATRFDETVKWTTDAEMDIIADEKLSAEDIAVLEAGIFASRDKGDVIKE